MTPCLGQLCPKEEELLPVATFRWPPSRLEGGGGSGVLEELPLQKRKTLGTNEASDFSVVKMRRPQFISLSRD